MATVKRSRLRNKADEAEEAELKAKKKKMYMLAGAGGAIALVLIVAVASVYWPRSEYIEKRDAATIQQDLQRSQDRVMQAEIERATARGESPAEIEKIRARYAEASKKLP